MWMALAKFASTHNQGYYTVPISAPNAFILRRLRVDLSRNFAPAFVISLFLGFAALIAKDGVETSIVHAILGQFNFGLMSMAFFPGLLFFSLTMASSALGNTISAFSWCSTRIWDLNITLSTVASGVSLGLAAPVVSGDIPNLSFENTISIIYISAISVSFYIISNFFYLFSRSPESLIFVLDKKMVGFGKGIVFSSAAIVGIVMLIYMASQSIQSKPEHAQGSSSNAYQEVK